MRQRPIVHERLYAGREVLAYSVPLVESDHAFKRPIVQLSPHWISPGLAMAAKVTPATEAELANLWHEIVRQVTDAGLALGVYLQPPPHREVLSARG